MPELFDLDVQEVSLVDKAANKRKFLVLKAHGKGATKMETNELILDVEDGFEDIIKAVALSDNPSEAEKQLEEIAKAAKLSDKGKKACQMALRVLQAVKTDMPKDMMKKLAEMAGYGYAPPEETKKANGASNTGYGMLAEEEENMAVQVITDSTSDMPEGLPEVLGIRIVPIYLRFGSETYRDGVDITRDEF